MSLSPRLASIDVFRAITMLLMIFVNDLWSVKNVPGWMEHTAAKADGMGLADTVFPAFLFIVGLSIPFAIQSRLSKGETTYKSLIYILIRSLALLVMGVFHVNLDDYDQSLFLPKPIWQLLITVGFFLVWLDYPATMKKTKKTVLQVTGIVLLVLMASLYKSHQGDQLVGMRTQWWGILGLIGWSYLLAAVIYLLVKDNIGWLIFSLTILMLFNIAVHAHWLTFLNPVKSVVWIAGDGALPFLTMAGVTASVIYRRFIHHGRLQQYTYTMVLIGGVMVLFGFALRPIGGISKIRATPSWAVICSGLSILVFVLLIYIVDIKKKPAWFTTIRPAGTSTLTCYLLPYIHYAVLTMVGISLPLFLRTGVTGIIKSLVYALVIILAAGLLEKHRIRLRI